MQIFNAALAAFEPRHDMMQNLALRKTIQRHFLFDKSRHSLFDNWYGMLTCSMTSTLSSSVLVNSTFLFCVHCHSVNYGCIPCCSAVVLSWDCLACCLQEDLRKVGALPAELHLITNPICSSRHVLATFSPLKIVKRVAGNMLSPCLYGALIMCCWSLQICFQTRYHAWCTCFPGFKFTLLACSALL